MIKKILPVFIVLIVACKPKVEKTKASIASISESVYASGIIKSKNQYEVFSNVNGIIKAVFVIEGDSVKKGSPILSISNDTQLLNLQNAELAANFSNITANRGKLNDARSFIQLSEYKMKNDSVLYFNQNNLWQQQIGTKTELERLALNYESSKNAYQSSIIKYNDLNSQLKFNASQSRNNLAITDQAAKDFIIKSDIDGVVYSLNKVKGENVGMQTALAIIGDSRNFLLEMQVDEYDILKIKKGLQVLVTLESYKGKVLEATVTKINPLMNESSRTFLVEAEFTDSPKILYPNITFEASIIIQTKQKALLIPRAYLLNDSLVIKKRHDTVVVTTGLKDYKKVEILSGISITDELIKPAQ